MKNKGVILALAAMAAMGVKGDFAGVEEQFRELPMEARQQTGPLFWLHGTESKDLLEFYLDRVAESGCGMFTTESRPHNDWLGEGWYRDLGICLAKAKQLGLSMYIFDDRWWPSQMMSGKVPPEYGAKRLEATETKVSGPKVFEAEGFGGKQYIGAVAGRVAGAGIDAASLIDLAPFVKDGKLSWKAPEGAWSVMKFTWRLAGPGIQVRAIAVDGADKDCVDWFIKTVYQPHYDRFKDDFGKTIRGYFYDEPETPGDWGREAMAMLAERGVDWKPALVAWKFKLAGDTQAAAHYQYADAFAEAWGRTMYGGMQRWCQAHGVVSMGHFMEHHGCLFDAGLCAGNMFQLQKYSDWGGIDLVCRQYYPGQRKMGLWQMPKLGSSIAHTYGKKNDSAMCEIYGAYGQDLTYPQMKGLIDQMQSRGINIMIPHSFNPRSPNDTDCPPYFYDGGKEPRYPLFRVLADYSSRLSLLLSGGRHVADVALLFPGQSANAGKCVRTDVLTDTLDDTLLDCDWVPYDAFGTDTAIADKQLKLHQEAYRILIVPPVEVIPYETLAKAKAFFDAGGVVAGYGFLPSKSATLGKTSKDIAALCSAIWGEAKQGTAVCKSNAAGGRSYFLPETPTAEQLRQTFITDAGIVPAADVAGGVKGGWLKVLHRVKEGRDVFFICDERVKGEARTLPFVFKAAGEPECWDALRNETGSLAYAQDKTGVIEAKLTLEPGESILVVFKEKAGQKKSLLPMAAKSWAVERMAAVAPAQKPVGKSLETSSWVWSGDGNATASALPGKRYFRKSLGLNAAKSARFVGSCDNAFTLYVNGKEAGKSGEGGEAWRNLTAIDVTKLLAKGANVLAICAENLTDKPSPAGLIGGLEVTYENGKEFFPVDAGWKAHDKEEKGWTGTAFDDSGWANAKELVKYGGAPWGALGGSGKGYTVSPVQADPFEGRCELPAVKGRVWLEMEDIAPEDAVRVTVNGKDAGGFIGKPYRLDVTRFARAGENRVEIVPFAPKAVRFVTEGK
jgi:hypothetical protein